LAASYLCGFGPDVQHLAILIHCAPEIREAAVDVEEHFVEMPDVARTRTLVT
jgi:hypothetical protein